MSESFFHRALVLSREGNSFLVRNLQKGIYRGVNIERTRMCKDFDPFMGVARGVRDA